MYSLLVLLPVGGVAGERTEREGADGGSSSSGGKKKKKSENEDGVEEGWRCLVISRSDGQCRSFTTPEQISCTGHTMCLDPVYNVLWRFVFIDIGFCCC